VFDRFRRALPEVVDLTGDPEFTLALMDRPWSWRQRQVEEMELGSASSAAGSSRRVTVTSGYQVRLPDGMEARLGVLRARVQLPLTRRPKGPYLDLDLHGPGGTPVTLATGSAIAALSARHLDRLARGSAAADAIARGLPAPLLVAVCRATPGGYGALEEREGRDRALAAYLAAALQLTATAADLRRWQQVLAGPAAVLADRLGEPADRTSTAENLLLALPRLAPLPRTAGEVDAVVRGWADGVRAAERARAERFLATLAEYGRRSEVVVELEAPLDEAFTVKLSELRPFNLGRSGWISERFRFDDARSVHLRARVESHWIEIDRYRVRDAVTGGDVAFPVLVDELATEKSVVVNSTRAQRPRFVDLELRLRINVDVRWTLWFVMGLAWAAAGAAILLPDPGGTGDLIDMLGLLAVPTTFAVSLLLTREESSLAARLQRAVRFSVLLATTVLWVAVVVRLVGSLLAAPR
jgi:hypothetical protein